MSSNITTESSQPAQNVPQHVAIIMDGNGRWARKRGLPRIKGHEEGAQSVRAVIRAARDTGVKYLTLYAFSVENWIRPKTEISALMNLLNHFLKHNEHELHENRVRLRIIGDMQKLPATTQKNLAKVIKSTENYEGGQLILALNYGSRTEITHAVRHIAQCVKDGRMDVNDINEETISNSLYAPDVPDPDLLIRTSGELRLSNFLLWQLSYTELYVTDIFWPEFRENDFAEAIAAFGKRKRRFGDIKERP